MEFLFIPLFLIFCGAAIAFLSGAMISFSLEEFAETEKEDALNKLKIGLDDNAASLRFFELSFFFLGLISAGLISYLIFNSGLHYLVSQVVVFILIYFFRTLFFAIGHRFSGEVIPYISGLLQILTSLGKPVSHLIKSIHNKISGTSHEDAAREELSAMVESAHEEGSIDQDEYRILKNIMKFSNVLVSDVMTPRTVVFSCHADSTVGEVLELAELQMYSRFPIWEGESLDDKVVGYVMSRDVLFAALKGKNSKKLRNLARDINFIPENAELDVALDTFLKKRQHIYLVVDEWGGIEGLLTMEDVLETILGVEIVDEADRFVDLRELAKQRRDSRIAKKVNQL